VRQGIIIPVYRHSKTACVVTDRLLKLNLPIILVDDGNEETEKNKLEEYAVKTNNVSLIRLDKNTGKGGAVIKGIIKANEMGLSHVIQIDADGQHDIEKTAFFLEESVKKPDMVICGFPEFDESAPKSRVIGRRISIFWAAIVTLSTELKDTHCGFRVYPVFPVFKIAKNPFLDKRMGFDTEILVRLYWNKIYPLFFPIKVTYPEGGISNFNMVKDNFRISLTFTRLCLGMIFRFPLLIIRKIKRKHGK
jgi:glycosyltransferase involved in cell wall biosynthesis